MIFYKDNHPLPESYFCELITDVCIKPGSNQFPSLAQIFSYKCEEFGRDRLMSPQGISFTIKGYERKNLVSEFGEWDLNLASGT